LNEKANSNDQILMLQHESKKYKKLSIYWWYIPELNPVGKVCQTRPGCGTQAHSGPNQKCGSTLGPDMWHCIHRPPMRAKALALHCGACSIIIMVRESIIIVAIKYCSKGQT